MTPPDLNPFTFQTAGMIVFGRGKAASAVEMIQPWGRRVLLVRGTSVEWADRFAVDLSQSGKDVSEHRTRGEPTLDQVRAAIAAGRERGVEQVVAVGGGSVIDLGKAAAALIPGQGDIAEHLEGSGPAKPLDTAPLPFTAIPTTAGTGTEVTKNAVIGIPQAQKKVSLRDARMFPRLAVVDPALTDGAPWSVTLASGMDALTQVIEPFLSARATPLTDALCTSVMDNGFAALEKLAQGENQAARDQLAYVSLTGGIALANAGLGAVHGFAGVIGGRTTAPHGLICARLLGPVLQANAEAAIRAKQDMTKYRIIEEAIARATGLPPERAFAGLGDWLTGMGLPRLSDWMDDPSDIPAICEAAQKSSSMQSNPHRLAPDRLASILASAL
ncbi:iron-containing alcohol dehydrogenase [Ruegeria sediminis]|uniref:Iron-containing alcohol dehydrogenase n=1 Tax=Ruegeria sediminis TaxID=2583820 RepID=A0ABY2WZS4_9RHOB|nr:iron-containing alcohol dehydrogenase [Ruegeria sediminis]TMV08480.1 iron-containing alcohol dehydrogenase [Ruegeria sediminis]